MPRSAGVCVENLIMFGRVVLLIRLQTHKHAHHNTPFSDLSIKNRRYLKPLHICMS